MDRKRDREQKKSEANCGGNAAERWVGFDLKCHLSPYHYPAPVTMSRISCIDVLNLPFSQGVLQKNTAF